MDEKKETSREQIAGKRQLSSKYSAKWSREARKKLKQNPKAYQAQLKRERAYQNAKYAEDPTFMKEAQKRYREKPEVNEHLKQVSTEWASKHPLQYVFNQCHSKFLTFVNGGRAVQNAIDAEPALEPIYKQDLLDMQTLFDDYIEAVENKNEDWNPITVPAALPEKIDAKVRNNYSTARNGAFRWGAPMSQKQFDSPRYSTFRHKMRKAYLERLYEDREVLNKRIKDLNIQ